MFVDFRLLLNTRAFKFPSTPLDVAVTTIVMFPTTTFPPNSRWKMNIMKYTGI